MLSDASWIGADEDVESPIFRQTFTASRIQKATIAICGLGFFELYMNGQRVGEDRFVPAWTNYEPRPGRRMLYPIRDTMRCRVTVMEYDLTPWLREGCNALGVRLGGGWYAQNRRQVEGDFQYGTPKLCYVVTLVDQDGQAASVCSGETVRWTAGDILRSNLYFGEEQDLRQRPHGFSRPDFQDAGWRAVHLVPAPETRLLPHRGPVDRVFRTVRPMLVHRDGDRRLYDCGENLSGYVCLRLPAAPGAGVTITHSEELSAGGTALDYRSTGGDAQIQTDRYICSNREELVHPHFTWHGFRYFELTGRAEVAEAAVVHADIPQASSFSCSDDTLNWLYDAYIRSQLTNIHSGVPSDCPHRERLGYTGDGQVTAEAAMLTLDARTLYDKWIEDIADGQDPVTGHVQHTAPFYGGGGGPGGWGSAIWKIPMVYYKRYGNMEMLRRYYPHIRRWLSYMYSRCEADLVVREEEGGWCLGEWCTPERPEIPEPFVNTYFFIKGLRAAMEAAELLQAADDRQLLRRWEKDCCRAMIRAYYQPQTGSFCEGVNGADAFALDLGLGDERTLRRLESRYRERAVLDTGIFGTDILIDVLFTKGLGDMAVRLLSQSFRHMREAGATTLWERWNGGDSHNHPMFGGVVRSFFTHILGIRQKEGSAGYRDVVIRPSPCGLEWAKGHILTENGPLAVEWQADEHHMPRVRHRP